MALHGLGFRILRCVASRPAHLGTSFSPDTAAYIAGLTRDLVCRWRFGNKRGDAVLLTTHGTELTFVDIIELMAVREIRRVRAVPLDRIREAIRVAREDYGITHPFARRHKTYLHDDQVVIETEDELLVQVSGRGKHQQMMRPIVEEYLERITYDQDTGLAEKYVAMRRGKYSIELNSKRGLGMPMVMPVGLSVANLVYTVGTEGSVAMAARSLEVPPQAVSLAIAYDEDRRSASKRAA